MANDPNASSHRPSSSLHGESWSTTYKENAGWMGIAAQWWILVFVLSAAGILGYTFFVRPVQLAGERNQNQQSQQYEATQIAGMRTDFDTVTAMDREISQYQAQPYSPGRDQLIATDQSQRANALNDIVRKRDLMPDKSKVPDDIAAYLSRNGR